ncbi:galactokinase [Nocardioides ferulae]|uniref:galactokinase n=1 Tax=Nocardioides ferulae TaxID=2340821 RepID=UPI000EAF8971|nr:galactokinase [Nocardioides ferulae]
MAFLDPGDPVELSSATRAGFRARYGADAALVARAPGRVNLIGEHTDYNAGLCLPVALPHATYAAVARRADDRVRVASLEADDTWEGTIAGAGPGGATGWAAYAAGVLWAMREAGHDVPGVDVLVHGTVPLGAGLSSSAALECSVAVAVAALTGRELDLETRRALVPLCMRAESEVAGAPTGGMDQTVALLAEPGTALLLDFGDDSNRAVPLGLEDAELTLLVTDTRVSHALHDGGYGDRRAECEAAAAALGVASLREAELSAVEALDDDLLRRRARHIVTENDRVAATVTALGEGDWNAVGRLLLASHVSMRDDFEISCDELDTVVTTAVEAGALGSRMTGGGFGGSAVSLVPLARLDAVMRAVDTAFVAAGFRPPAHLQVDPAARAELVP